jgi:integrase
MRGSIFKRGNLWTVQIERDHDPATGKRRREWHSGFKTKAEAEDARVRILADLQRGEHVPPDKLTVRAFLEDEWLPAMGPSLRPSTFQGYALDVRRAVEQIGERRLQSLTPAMLNRLYGALAERLAPRTVRGVHTVLRQALADAVAWQRLPRNPADRAKPPSLASVSDIPPRTWSASELDQFLAHVADDRLAAAWRVLAMTGLRRGELVGLGWDAVDLDAGRLAITRTLIEGKGAPRFSEPKTKRGRRSVALDAETVDTLRGHRERQLDERLAWGPAYRDHGLVFCRENGTPIWPRTFSRSFDHHVRDAGLPKIRLHDLRHTHATLALEAGVHPKVVQERLGHATIAITLDTYSHAIPAMQEDAAAKIAALLER